MYLEISVSGIVVDIIGDLGHAAPLGVGSQPQDTALQGLGQVANPAASLLLSRGTTVGRVTAHHRYNLFRRDP